MTRRATALLICLIAAMSMISSASGHRSKHPTGYPFSGNLDKREAWQVQVLKHARSHLGELRGGTVLVAADQKVSIKATRHELRRWIRAIKRELGETRAAIAAQNKAQISAPFGAPSVAVYDQATGQWTIPAYIVMCESGGDYNAVNGSSGAYGAYQIMPFHWSSGVCQGLGMDPAGQDECAARIWNSAGAGAWACS